MAKGFLKTITHGPPTCACAIQYAIYSDNPADPAASELRPKRIVARCLGHRGVFRPSILDAMFRRDTDLLRDTMTRVHHSGAALAIGGFDATRRLVVSVTGATEELRADLARFPALVVEFAD